MGDCYLNWLPLLYWYEYNIVENDNKLLQELTYIADFLNLCNKTQVLWFCFWASNLCYLPFQTHNKYAADDWKHLDKKLNIAAKRRIHDVVKSNLLRICMLIGGFNTVSTIFQSYHSDKFSFSCASWLSSISTPHNILSKQLAAFQHRLLAHWWKTSNACHSDFCQT